MTRAVAVRPTACAVCGLPIPYLSPEATGGRRRTRADRAVCFDPECRRFMETKAARRSRDRRYALRAARRQAVITTGDTRGFMAEKAVLVRLTPHQAAAAVTALERASYDVPADPTDAILDRLSRLSAVAVSVQGGLVAAGWAWDADTETWRHPSPAANPMKESLDA